MKKFILAFLIFTLLASGAEAQKRRIRTIAPPTLVEAAPPPPAPKAKAADATFGLTIERHVSNIEVGANGAAVQTIESLRRFESATAISQLNFYEQFFISDIQKLEVLEAYNISAAGKKTPVAPDKIQIKLTPQAEAAPAFSTLKSVKITFDPAQPGDAAFFKIRLTDTAPVFAGHFTQFELLPAIFAWKSAEINVTAPAGYELFTESVALEGGKLPEQSDKIQRWQWRVQNFPAVEYEAQLSSVVDYSPRVALTSFKNYDELGAVYWREVREKAAVTPEIQKLADDITKNIAEPQAQAAAIYEWANKNIRYLLIIMGRGGWIPHSTGEILANGYGDCKDYTMLMYALLKAKNIESQAILIRADTAVWHPSVAVPDYFNHLILYIPSLDLFADATAPNTRLGLLPQVLAGKYAVIAGENRAGKIQLPAGKPADAEFVSDTEVNFTPDGAVKAVSKNQYRGRTEMIYRPIFSDSRIAQNSEQLMRIILAVYGVEGTGKILKISDAHRVGEPFAVETEVNLADYTTFLKTGSLTVPIALNLQNLIEVESLVQAEKRRTNLNFGAMRYRENFKLNFPPSVKIEAVPPALNVENAAGHFRREFKIEGNSVTLTREFVTVKDVYEPADYAALRDLVKKTVADYNAEIRYTADARLFAQKSALLKKRPRQPKITAESSIFEKLLTDRLPKKLPAREVVRLEAALRTAPDDEDTRRRLLLHYVGVGKDTPAVVSNRIRHSVWFIQNRPQTFGDEIFGSFNFFETPRDTEYQTLKKEWLAQIAANPTDAVIRQNAIDYIMPTEWQEAEKLLVEGRKTAPDNFIFAATLADLYGKQAKDKPAAERKKFLNLAFETGEAALRLLKKERSEERDELRGELLPKMAAAAEELGNLERARVYATELILEFGNDPKNSKYAAAAHSGNIVLGKIALKERDIARAKEYLLIAARAPQRSDFNYTTPDTTLARLLLETGEKDAVLEYLKLCEAFEFADKETLQRWQTEIKAGKTPDFKQE